MEENNKAGLNVGARLLSDAPFQSLLTLERSQKLDLLIHLITNLRQSLIICGAQGIGKTMLLTVLQEKIHESRQYCLIKGSSALSFEQIQQQIRQMLEQYTGDELFDLTHALMSFDKQNHKIVVIIDDAENLVAGLAGSLIQYAAANPALRVVFSLSNEGLSKKLTTDQVLSDCHFIELPPLNRKQCAEFMQQQLRRSVPLNSLYTLDNELVDRIYRDSHGVPGKILEKLSQLNQSGKTINHTWIYLAGATALIVLALSYIDWSGDADNKSTLAETVKKAADEPKVAAQQKTPSLLKNVTALPVVNTPVVEKVLEVKTETGQTGVEIALRDIVPEKMVLPLHAQGLEQSELTEPGSPDKDLPPESPVKSVVTALSDPVVDSVQVSALTQGEVMVNKIEPKPAQPVKADQDVKPKSEQIQMIEVGPEVKPKSEPSPAILPEMPVVETVAVVAPNNNQQPVIKKVVEPERVVVSEKKPAPQPKQESVKTAVDDNAWLVAQSGKSYTIQLMALSQMDSVNKELKKHRGFKEKTKVIKIVTKSKTKYLLLYGAFNDNSQAQAAMQSLPQSYRKSWLRKIKDVQKEVK